MPAVIVPLQSSSNSCWHSCSWCQLLHWQVIEELGITTDQFVDVCILCGCDYAGTIRGIGAVRALQLVQKHGAR